MNKQSKFFVTKRETINAPGKQPALLLTGVTINKGKQYPYMPKAARDAMIKSERERQARAERH